MSTHRISDWLRSEAKFSAESGSPDDTDVLAMKAGADALDRRDAKLAFIREELVDRIDGDHPQDGWLSYLIAIIDGEIPLPKGKQP